MNRSAYLRSAFALLLLLPLPLAGQDDGAPPRERARLLEDLWQTAANLLPRIELPNLCEAIFLFSSPEPAEERRGGELDPAPTPTLGAEMDPNG